MAFTCLHSTGLQKNGDFMKVNFHAVTALPSALEANAFYFVLNGTRAEAYLTDSAAAAKSVGNTVMINTLISSALAEWEKTSNAMPIVADIAARDSLILTLEKSAFILVLDASGDPTVDAGSALYAYDFDTTTTYKVAEYESMDVVIKWASIQDGPSSSVAEIDGAVGKAHSHDNKVVLDKFTESEGQPLFAGQPIASTWTTKDW